LKVSIEGGADFKRYCIPNCRSRAAKGAEAKVYARWGRNKILLVGGAERANRLVSVKK
jgi:hypothetical protein